MSNKLYRVINKVYHLYSLLDNHVDYRGTRPMILNLEQRRYADMIGVEIGTQRGINAYNMLNHLSIKKLYLIDPYEFYDYDGRSPNAVDSNNLQKNYYDIAQQTLKKYRDKIEFVRKKSEDAADIIPNQIDFVYIDGNHDYPYIKKDIELYYPKVKKGGFFGGHDIHLNDVFRAVSELRNDVDKDIHIKRVDWWFIK